MLVVALSIFTLFLPRNPLCTGLTNLSWFLILVGSSSYTTKSRAVFTPPWTRNAAWEAKKWDKETWSLAGLWSFDGEAIFQFDFNFCLCVTEFTINVALLCTNIAINHSACSWSLYVWSAQNVTWFVYSTKSCYLEEQWKSYDCNAKYDLLQLVSLGHFYTCIH